MSLATVSTAVRSVAAADRPAFTLHRLRRAWEQRRQQRLDRMVEEMVRALDHAGIAEDYRLARGPSPAAFGRRSA